MIRIRDLEFAYPNGEPVLRGIDLDLRPGEHVTILGPNGSGKSTLLKCIAGLLTPTAGSISRPDDVPGSIGLVFQNPDDQIVSPIVESEIAFGLENTGVPRDEMVDRVASVLDRFDLTRYRSHDPNTLSGGERQRLAIASVVVMRPQYVLFDEPYSMLDPAFRTLTERTIASLTQDGITPVVVCQDPDHTLDADRLIVLEGGRIVSDGSPHDVLSRPDRLPTGLATTTAGRLAVALRWQVPVPVTPDELVQNITSHPVPPISQAPSRRLDTDVTLDIQDLQFSYDAGLPTEHIALRGVTMSVTRGSVVSLVGPSGSGKSTLMLHLNGLHQPSRGSIRVCDLDASDPETHDLLRQRVGMVFQFPESQLFAETVRDDVAYGPTNLGMDDIEGRVERALESVGLASHRFLDRNPLTLSGGEKRRVALAGVLATEPDLLVLDEPNAGLDPSGGDDLDRILRELSDRGTTLMIVTHDLARAAALSDRIVGLVDGRIAIDQPVADLLQTPELLAELGVPLPPSIALLERLRSAGVDVPKTVHTSDQLVDLLARSYPS